MNDYNNHITLNLSLSIHVLISDKLCKHNDASCDKLDE